MIERIVDFIVNQVVHNFDFGFMCIINVATYLLIKLYDDLNGDAKVPLARKRGILVFTIVFATIVYNSIGYSNLIVLINSAILAPVAWSWVFKPIAKRLGIDYKQIDKTLNE